MRTAHGDGAVADGGARSGTRPQPSLDIQPRPTTGGLRLATSIGVDELERANRRLAHALGADLACVDAARILRPLSVGGADGADVSPARSFADASATDRGDRR
jgi:hypothetical protein